MKTKKCLLFIRTSTSKQETESQLKETKEYAESLGYNEFVTIGKAGASAYKVADEYLALIDEMKSTVEKDPEIKAVVCWAMNRLFRNIKMADELKEWFVDNKIQLEIKEPHIKLLEDDGTLSNSSEMVFHFFAVFNKQQIDELRKKSSRAKRRDKELHKYIGGYMPPFGYRLDENKFIVPDPVNAPILQEIFNLYATGDFSYKELTQEINERYGTSLCPHSMRNFLTRKLYYDDTMYPPIISEEQFKKCEEQRRNSTGKPSSYKHHTFANRLIRCKCGRGYTSCDNKYICSRRIHGECDAPTISLSNLDGLLWLISSHLESDRMLKSDNKKELLENKAVLEAKIKSMDNYTIKGEKRSQRAKKMALEGLIEIDEYKDILKEVEIEQKEVMTKIENWKSDIREIERLISEDGMTLKRILELSDKFDSYDEEKMYNIVRRWVKRITFQENVFTIETLARTYKAVYNRYGYASRWYTVNGNPIATKPIERVNDICRFGTNKCTPKDIPVTMAWLGGSEIV